MFERNAHRMVYTPHELTLKEDEGTPESWVAMRYRVEQMLDPLEIDPSAESPSYGEVAARDTAVVTPVLPLLMRRGTHVPLCARHEGMLSPLRAKRSSERMIPWPRSTANRRRCQRPSARTVEPGASPLAGSSLRQPVALGTVGEQHVDAWWSSRSTVAAASVPGISSSNPAG